MANELPDRRTVLKWMLAAASTLPLGLGAASAVRAETASQSGEPRQLPGEGLGLALGSGGAAGLSHILVFEVLDELGLRPRHIAGSSIGALLGAFYASGMSGREIREMVIELVPSNGREWLGALFNRDWAKAFAMLRPGLENVNVFEPDEAMAVLDDLLGAKTFGALEIPLTVVATDLWAREEVLFTEGELLRPLLASAAMPGVFQPVHYQDRVLVDGGMVNPVPFEHVTRDGGLTVAVDVLGKRSKPDNDEDTGYMDGLFNTFKVMQHAIITQRRRLAEPDIFLAPEVTDVRVLEFYRYEQIFSQAKPAAEHLKRELEARLG